VARGREKHECKQNHCEKVIPGWQENLIFSH
jgi:hypothetical protein